jgi:hypothetical protein
MNIRSGRHAFTPHPVNGGSQFAGPQPQAREGLWPLNIGSNPRELLPLGRWVGVGVGKAKQQIIAGMPAPRLADPEARPTRLTVRTRECCESEC